MARLFTSRHDVCMRLNNTICFLDDEPIYITCREGDDYADANDVKYTPMDNLAGRKKTVNVGDERFSYKARPLGYVNHPQLGMIWVSRIPYRQQKAGISFDSLIYTNTGGDVRNMGAMYMLCTAGREMLKNIYPDVDEALERMNKGVNGVAIAFEVGLMRLSPFRSNLHYRGRSVGVFDHQTRRVALFPGPDQSWFQNTIQNLLAGKDIIV